MKLWIYWLVQFRSAWGDLSSGTTELQIQMISFPPYFCSAWLSWFLSQADTLLQWQETPTSPHLVLAPYNLRRIKQPSTPSYSNLQRGAVPGRRQSGAQPSWGQPCQNHMQLGKTSSQRKQWKKTKKRNVYNHEEDDYLVAFAEMKMKSTCRWTGQTVPS